MGLELLTFHNDKRVYQFTTRISSYVRVITRKINHELRWIMGTYGGPTVSQEKVKWITIAKQQHNDQITVVSWTETKTQQFHNVRNQLDFYIIHMGRSGYILQLQW